VYAADTETCLIRPGLKAPPLVCVSWSEPDLEVQPPVALPAKLVRYLHAYEVCKMLFEGHSVWANAAYDLAVIAEEFPELIPLIFDALDNDRVEDVIIRQRLIDIAHGRYYGFYIDPTTGKNTKIMYSVQALTKRLLGIDLEKDEWRLKYGTLREVPVEEWPKGAQRYSKLDAEILIPIWVKQQEHAKVLADQYRQVRADFALHLTSCWGLRTSRQAVEEIDRRTQEEFDRLQAELVEVGLIHGKKGARNTKRAKELLFEHLPRDQWKLTKTGYRKVMNGDMTEDDAFLKGRYISVDEDSCERSGHPSLIKYARYAAVQKLRSTYVNGIWEGVKTPIQPRYLVLVETGRTSCSNINLQNLPREPGIRECCVPREGCVLVACDYDKAELVSLAEMCISTDQIGFSRLGQRLIEGGDPHADMGAMILGIKPEQIGNWKKEGAPIAKALCQQAGVSKIKFPERSSLEEIVEIVRNDYGLKLTRDQATWLQRLDMVKWSRQMAKAANFGFPGGLGAETFVEYARGSYGVELTVEEAAQLRSKWNKAWPEMQEYFRFINTLLDGGEGFIIQPISGRYRGGVSYTQCCNSFFQQRTADGAKAAGWEITKRQFTQRASALYGTHCVVFVHDEWILEVPEARCHEAAMELREVMVDEFRKFHPNMAKAVRATPVAMRHWSKLFDEPKYVDGRLVPWGERKLLSAA